jgi:hypothetical protein
MLFDGILWLAQGITVFPISIKKVVEFDATRFQDMWQLAVILRKLRKHPNLRHPSSNPASSPSAKQPLSGLSPMWGYGLHIFDFCSI